MHVLQKHSFAFHIFPLIPDIDLHLSFTLVGEHSFWDWLRVFHVPYPGKCSRRVWNQYMLIHWKGCITQQLNECKSSTLYYDFFCLFVLATIESGTQKPCYKTITFIICRYVSSFLISIFVLY